MIGADWDARQFREQWGDSPAEPERFAELMSVAGMPRSSGYDPTWVYLNQMGPNVLWLAEALVEKMELRPGMRVLDMGCGTAISSIFLAREFGVEVWATDLWIPASDNWSRVREANLEDKITPIHAEAHSLPFADGFFNAAICLDAFHYFGTDDLYFAYYSRFVREGGYFGMVVPGNEREADEMPEDMRDFWVEAPWEFFSFHGPDWWRRNWLRIGLVDIEAADMVPGGRELWLRWSDISGAWEGRPDPYGERESLLETESGSHLGFTRLVARKKERP